METTQLGAVLSVGLGVFGRAIVACSTLQNTCPDCGRVVPDAAERARHIKVGKGCADPCHGCGNVRPLIVRALDEPNPDDDDPFFVRMCLECWAKYDGPDGDKYAWGQL